MHIPAPYFVEWQCHCMVLGLVVHGLNVTLRLFVPAYIICSLKHTFFCTPNGTFTSHKHDTFLLCMGYYYHGLQCTYWKVILLNCFKITICLFLLKKIESWIESVILWFPGGRWGYGFEQGAYEQIAWAWRCRCCLYRPEMSFFFFFFSNLQMLFSRWVQDSKF